MTEPNGKNGSGLNGAGKITSLDEARRNAAARAKDKKRQLRDSRPDSMRLRDWIIGALFVLMAVGMVWHWFSPLAGTMGATR